MNTSKSIQIASLFIYISHIQTIFESLSSNLTFSEFNLVTKGLSEESDGVDLGDCSL